MSSIRLTNELLGDIQAALEKHDEQARDAGVGIQYLAALVGVMTAQFPGEAQQKQAILRQLFEFSEAVFKDHLESSEPEAQSAAGDAAFGIWKPDQS